MGCLSSSNLGHLDDTLKFLVTVADLMSSCFMAIVVLIVVVLMYSSVIFLALWQCAKLYAEMHSAQHCLCLDDIQPSTGIAAGEGSSV